jgi:hypothetical protein
VRVPSGQPVRLDFEVRDLAGELVTPGSVKMELLGPTDTVPQTITVPTTDGVGLYHSILDAEIVSFGHYAWKFSTTAPGKTVQTGTLDVYDPFAQEIVSLDEAKDYLKIEPENTSLDDELAAFIRTIVPAVEFFAGPVEPKTYRRTGYGYFEVVLSPAPVISITSVDSYGTPIDPTLLSIDYETGIVYYTDLRTVFPRGRMTFTFIAGRRIIPANITHGAKVILAHMWETQRGRGRTVTTTRRTASDDTTFVPGLGYSVPNRAIEMLKPSSLRTGLA